MNKQKLAKILGISKPTLDKKLGGTPKFKNGTGLNYLDYCNIQKWLRDEHKLYVAVDWDQDDMDDFGMTFFRYSITQFLNAPVYRLSKGSYEDALKEGVKEALKLIGITL